jgi:hypothetical protein
MGGREEDMDGERLKSGAGKERVELTDPRRPNGNLEDSPSMTAGNASSSESLMTWTWWSEGSTLTVIGVGTWTVEVELGGVIKTVEADICASVRPNTLYIPLVRFQTTPSTVLEFYWKTVSQISPLSSKTSLST